MNKIIFVLFLAVSVFGSLFSAEKKFGDYTAHLKADRDGSVYKIGEDVEFVLKLKKKSVPAEGVRVAWRISKDSIAPFKNGEASVENGELKIPAGTLNEAGFLKCEVRLILGKKATQPILAAAAFDPLEIKPSLPVPEDFAAYWQKQKEILAAIAMNPKSTPVSQIRHPDKVEVFDVCADSFKNPMRGYLAKPKGAKPKSLPAIILPHQGGVRSSYKPENWALQGYIALDFNAHGIPNGEPREFYDKLNKGELSNYRTANKHDRNAVAFRAMFMRLMRAIDFICAQPEWDGKTLVVFGGSQAAAQAIVAAGLCPERVTYAAAMAPALCDHSGAVVGRACGWPRFAELKVDGSYDKKAVEEMRYFDVMNFAAFVKCPVVVGVGFIDTSCQPSTVYAMYSNIKSPKTLLVAEESGHEIAGRYEPKAKREMDKFLKKRK